MHDLDRVTMEFDEADGFESADWGRETGGDEMELASELLSVRNDAELDQFLGKLISGVKKFANSSLGKSLGGMLKGLAKKALPIAGTAVGTLFGGPLGAAVGGNLAGAAGKLFGLELEGMSNEDQEFEVARRFVRLAQDAARHAGGMGQGHNPMANARRALMMAARNHAPGLARRLQQATQGVAGGDPDAGPDEYQQYESDETGDEVFDEYEENELANEFLTVSNEGELDQFLGKLVQKGLSKVREYVGGPKGKAVKACLKGCAKKCIQEAVHGGGGGAAPADAGDDGSSQELDLAKRFVRTAGEAIKDVAQSGGNPIEAAKSAVRSAAGKFLPDLMGGGGGGSAMGHAGGSSGRWVRRGNKIILLGV